VLQGLGFEAKYVVAGLRIQDAPHRRPGIGGIEERTAGGAGDIGEALVERQRRSHR